MALLAELAPYAARLRAATEQLENARRALAAAEVEHSAARQEFEVVADQMCRGAGSS